MTPQPNTFILRGSTRDSVQANLVKFLGRLPPDKGWVVEIKPWAKRRTGPQNRYLWGVVYATLEAATGQDAADWHEYLRGEFFGWAEIRTFDRTTQRPERGSSKLTTAEFAAYVEYVQRKCAENGIYIPDPDPAAQEE